MRTDPVPAGFSTSGAGQTKGSSPFMPQLVDGEIELKKE
jgi:hypothetical protein